LFFDWYLTKGFLGFILLNPREWSECETEIIIMIEGILTKREEDLVLNSISQAN
jgi:hypothetical protein